MSAVNTNMAISTEAVDRLFVQARSYASWTDKPVNHELIHQLYELAKWGPTSMNCLPMRLVFITTEEARQRLLPSISAGNVDKVQHAPVTVIIAADTRFYEHMPVLFPYIEKVENMFIEDQSLSQQTAFRNSSLQGAYVLLAARSLGLDTGAMSGFDPEKIDRDFFPDGRFKTNFIMNIGYGDHSKLHPRGPRLDFDQVAQII